MGALHAAARRCTGARMPLLHCCPGFPKGPSDEICIIFPTSTVSPHAPCAAPQMMHLVDSVSQYINDRVAAAGAWLEQVRGGPRGRACARSGAHCALRTGWYGMLSVSCAHLLRQLLTVSPHAVPTLQATEGCATLDDMHRCRAKYLRAVARYCLLG